MQRSPCKGLQQTLYCCIKLMEGSILICSILFSGKTSHAAVGRIALTMCLAAASGGITQSIVSGLVQIYNRHEHYNTNEIANAVLANLVAVTGCCPFIEPPFALLIGRKCACVALVACMHMC